MKVTPAGNSKYGDVRTEVYEYPGGLLEWAGHRSGGVRRLFYEASGRAAPLIETPLLRLLRGWADGIVAEIQDQPHTVLLVGGPGNGKTEAVEDAIRQIERAADLAGKVQAVLRPLFDPSSGQTVPRTAQVDLASLGFRKPLSVTLVQDASVRESAHLDVSAARALVADLRHRLEAPSDSVYLACVNRGVLDDALIAARETGQRSVTKLLEAVVSAVGAGVTSGPCWPLGVRGFAVWPMDVESLFRAEAAVESPAAQLLAVSTSGEKWPQPDTCAAGDRCPFCTSRALLADEPHRSSLLRILRFYELASGKRWTFRDLLSLYSFLLAGSPEEVGASATPCEWAARLVEASAGHANRSESLRTSAPFLLVAAQYQHALFGSWPKLPRSGFRSLLRDLKLEQNDTLLGLNHFLARMRGRSVPRTLQAELESLCGILDPAVASPDGDIEVSGRTSLALRDIDFRFSHSVREGLDFIRRYHALSANELELLKSLADADDAVGEPDVRRRKPVAAARVQAILRTFACRLVRRSFACRNAAVKDAELLAEFEQAISGDDQLMYQISKKIESLLNEHEKFALTLNSTFGEPPPPPLRRVVLATPKQKVKSAPRDTQGRPLADLTFMIVGGNQSSHHLPLTYEIFRSVRQLQEGMEVASLPRSVQAAIDAARARLAGRVVRDPEALDGSEMSIGARPERIAVEMGNFIIRLPETA